MAEKKGIKIAAQNRKAFHDYFVEDRYEAGIELKGTEVKSIRAGTLNLKDSYVIVKNGEANVLSMHISPYDKGNIFNHDPDRPKKLLLHKREIGKLYSLIKQDGYALIPLSVYFKDARVKVEVGVCKGKKNYAVMSGELYPEIAPNTVNNFIALANSGFYDGVVFHRVIPGFMIQGGDPDGNGTGGPGYEIKGEFSANGFKNDLKHTLGVLSMARTMIPDSAGSQFFIMVADAPHLDGQYAAFGKITENAQAAVDISRVNRNMYNDMPKKPQVIKTIRVDTQGVDYPEPEKM